MPDPICPLFEELYLTRGLESPRPESLMVGGGPMFVTLNGFAYQRFDWPQIIAVADRRRKRREPQPISEEDIEAAEFKAPGSDQEIKGASAKQRCPTCSPSRKV